jgi:hypothetical protein
MGEGEQRRFKRNARFDTRELARVSSKHGRPARESRATEGDAKLDDPALSRAATLDDPLTTSLLAEVVRRSRTVDVLPEQIDEARDIEPQDRDPGADATEPD